MQTALIFIILAILALASILVILVDRVDTRPLLVIELDGGSHNDQERARRDKFIDTVFKDAAIPLLRIPVRGFYAYVDLRQQIEQYLAK